jgi:hypothetical protein
MAPIEQLFFQGLGDERQGEIAHVEHRRLQLARTDGDSCQSALRRTLFLELARRSGETLEQDVLVQRLLRPVERDTSGRYAELMENATKDAPIGDSGSHAGLDAKGRREDYGRISGGERTEALGGLIRTVTFNSGFPIESISEASSALLADSSWDPRSEGEKYHSEGALAINMTWPELSNLREELRHVRNQHGIQVWLPCHAEPGVANMNVDYAAQEVSPASVSCVNTNRRDNSAVRETQRYLARSIEQYPEVTVGLQDAVLRCVDWRRIAEVFHIPLGSDNMPEGQAKGLTLLALALIAEARGRLGSGFVALHDTDIINPREYLALDYMTIPLWAPGEGGDLGNLLGIYVARTGPGRNNQPIHAVLNGILAEPGGSTRSLARELAINVLMMPWPLTGERMIRAHVLRRLPWTNDMTIESQINVMLAGEAVSRRAFTTAQVMNPHPKFECADVSLDREWRMMNYCAHYHRVLIERCNLIGKVLGDWTATDIKDFNQATQSSSIVGVITNDAGATGSIAFATRPPYMLPSVEMLRGMNLVDLDAVERCCRQSREVVLKVGMSARSRG